VKNTERKVGSVRLKVGLQDDGRWAQYVGDDCHNREIDISSQTCNLAIE
jgi:hypothetical protein